MNKDECPKCGTTDCISSEEYKRKIRIEGAGVMSIDSNILAQSCKFRQQVKLLRETRDCLKQSR